MNASNREGWQPQQQQQPQATNSASHSASNQQTQTAPSGSSGAPVLPPPQGAFFSNPPSSHNLPGLAGLSQATQTTSAHNQNNMAYPSAEQSHQHHTPQPSYALPSMSQHQLQPHPSIEIDRDPREMGEMARREMELRDREMRDRQHHEQQQPRENHAPPIQIHQPVAIPPRVQSIHGPSGLLGNPSVISQATAAQMGAAQTLFTSASAGPLHQTEVAPRVQQSIQQQQLPIGIPFTTQIGQQPAGNMNQAQQPILNDALSYLDQVKVQFADHPDVYNRFLDIMKDFKSGAIDTPGVIERVSHLFAGNPGLIQGFNTFLPPGYKIECGTGDDPNAIRVTTPMGTTISRMPAARTLSPPRRSTPMRNGGVPGAGETAFFDAAGRMGWQQQQPPVAQDMGFGPEGRGAPQSYGVQSESAYAPLSPEAQREQLAAAAIHQQEQRGVSHLQNAAAAASAGTLSSKPGPLSSPGDVITPLQAQLISNGMQQAMNNGGLEKRGPVEFNHAINYVNKIKNRFGKQPDIYKQFLEILQTYQRESKPIQDVYAQVTLLFEAAPDLLEDFKQFLPESAAQSKQAAARANGEEVFPLSSARTEPTYQAAVAAHGHLLQTPRPEQPRLPPMGNFAPTPSANRDTKRKRERPGVTAPIAPSVAPEATGGRIGPTQATSGSKRPKVQPAAKPTVAPEAFTIVPSLVPPLPQPLPPTVSLGASTDEIAFFDRVRKHISNKGQYGEFLKLVNLYTQDLCSVQFLVYRAHSFIGSNPELMLYFKNFLHYDGADEVVDNQPTSVHGKIQLSNCRSMGPSYRLLPRLDNHKKCSGRDQLCNSVLNDDWVSHPTWASEDSGFVAHRKNIHEEGLHRIEEERHDYDFYIESCERTIQLLEPIAQNLNSATPDVRRGFRLDPKLGGQSESIYKRVVYKVYGRPSGNEVLGNLFARPYDVVPILLTRLKAKLAEWKAAQGQWNCVWRQQTNQYFYRSLDHQGVSTRVADKRQFWPKQLINEAQVRYHEQKRQRSLGVPNLKPYQFSCHFADDGVLRDASRLVLNFADHNLSTEYPKIVGFIKEFLSLYFIDHISYEQDGPPSHGSLDDGEESPLGQDDESSPRQRSNNKHKNLLRGVLDKSRGVRVGKRENGSSAASDSRGTSPENTSTPEDDAMDVDVQKPEHGVDMDAAEKWFHHPIDSNFVDGQKVRPNEQYKRHVYNMYCNGTIYCFIRMFTMLYERLAKLKANEEEVHRIVHRAVTNKPAYDVGWIEKVPSDYFEDTSRSANYYKQMLEMFHGLVKTETDVNVMEETLRRFYLQDGWQLYSLDKLLGGITRFAVQTTTSDGRDKTADIYQLFKKDRLRGEYTSNQEELNYRRQVDKHTKAEDVFRISFDDEKRTAYIQLFKNDEPTFDPSILSLADRWKVYVSSYENVDATEGVRYDQPPAFPYLRRGVRQQWGEDRPSLDAVVDQIKSKESLDFRIMHGSESKYRLYFEPGAFEYAIVNNPKVSRSEVDTEALRRGEVAKEIFEINNDWMKGMTQEEVTVKKQAYQQISASD